MAEHTHAEACRNPKRNPRGKLSSQPLPRPAFALRPSSARAGFLESLRSKGRYCYSRYGGLPLRYAGGKSLAVGYIVEHLPEECGRLVSPFMGGGSVEIAARKNWDCRSLPMMCSTCSPIIGKFNSTLPSSWPRGLPNGSRPSPLMLTSRNAYAPTGKD